MIWNIFPHAAAAADKTKIKNIKRGDRVADWRSEKNVRMEIHFTAAKHTKNVLSLIISVSSSTSSLPPYQDTVSQELSNTHRSGYPSLSNWMDRNSNTEWLSISPLSMKFNEQPYLLKCVCVVCTMYIKWQTHVLMTTSVCVWCIYSQSHRLYNSNQWSCCGVCLFGWFFFIRVCIQQDRIDTRHTHTHINTNTCRCSDRYRYIQMLIMPLSKKDIYLSKE